MFKEFSIFLFLTILFYCSFQIDFFEILKAKGGQVTIQRAYDVEVSSTQRQTPSRKDISIFQADQISIKNSKNVIIYNRIPKCGSETMAFLFRKLFENQKIKIWSSECFWKKGEKHDMDFKFYGYRQMFINDLSHRKNFVYIRHMPFVNFSSAASNDASHSNFKPLWINMLRDPISRYISNFYYDRRGPAKLRKLGQFLPVNLKFTERERNITLEEIFEKFIPEGETLKNEHFWKYLRPVSRAQINYFCGNGHEEICQNRDLHVDRVDSVDSSKSISTLPQDLYSSKQARDLAIKNMQENYIFIGIIEDFQSSLELLELIFPDFIGLQKLLKKYNSFTKHEFETFEKPTTSNYVKNRLKPLFKYEYDVYEFGKSMFYEKLGAYRRLRNV